MELRPSVLAGQWYPRSPEECARFLATLPAPDVDVSGAVGAIVPHAGWVYSGEIAFGALRLVAVEQPAPDLVVIYGGHLARHDHPRLFVEGGFETPLGPLAVPEELAQDLAMALTDVDLENPEEFYEENGVEVLLPMVKRLWPDAPVLAIGSPPTIASIALGKEVVDLAKRRGYRRIALIGSTDLTHYGPNYDFSPKGSGARGLAWVNETNDPAVISPMCALDAAQVLWVAEREHNACCAGAAAAAISGARLLGAERGVLTRHATSWDLRPSGDAPSSFVGYAGIVLAK
ncbi:MAG: AmmeMemoRadiSam system protein B [Deltaproteobacteria bacterium]|nr:AmmeMemoRadiSam system protein B [Deltaproteobacteria bacterium]